MRRMSRAAALIAVTVALAFIAFGCKKDEAKKPEEAAAESKKADSPAADPAQAAAPTAPNATSATDPPATGQPDPAGAATPMTPAAPPQRPPSVTDEHVGVANKLVEATNKFADELDAAKSDCKKATAVVKNGGPAVKVAMAATDKLQTQLNTDPAAMQWFQSTYAPKMMGAVGKLGGVFTQCGKDKDFEAAFKNLELGGRPPPDAPPPDAPPPKPKP